MLILEKPDPPSIFPFFGLQTHVFSIRIKIHDEQMIGILRKTNSFQIHKPN